jgi:hypothetical protein
MDTNTTRISHFLFSRHLYLVPGKRFLFIDLAIIIKDTKNQGATCTTSNATHARRGSGSISRGLLFLPIRDTQCLFPFGMTRQLARESKASEPELYARKKDSDEEGSTGHGDIYCSGIFVSELGSFYFYFFFVYCFMGSSALG